MALRLPPTGPPVGHDPGMGVLFDYFAADSDEDAALAIDRLGGPGAHSAPNKQALPQRRGWFRRVPAPPDTPAGLTPAAFDTVQDTGIDPVVQLGTLEELLTGRPYDEVVADPRSGHQIALRDNGERAVCAVTHTLTQALANLPRARARDIAVAWAQTEEFWGAADPDDLQSVLLDLSALAARARANSQSLYCWACV